MEGVSYFFSMLGDALNGVFQVITDFFNLLVEIIPNPDPFPEMIEQMPNNTLMDWGFAAYWLDNLIGVQFMHDALTAWFALLAAGMVFCTIFWVVRGLKP